MSITDFQGRPIPADARIGQPGGSGPGGPQSVFAIPPVYQYPDGTCIEFLFSAFGNLAAAGSTFIDLSDALPPNAAFTQTIDKNYRGKIANVFFFCADMLSAAAPYLFARVLVNDQPANGWGTIPIGPRNGIATLSFDTQLFLPPGAKIGMQVENTDAASAHFCLMYLYGWTWPK